MSDTQVQTLPATAIACDKFTQRDEYGWFIPIVTLILWLGCATIALLGFILPYVRPHSPTPQVIVHAEILNVELGDSSPLEQEPLQQQPAPPDAMVQPPVAQPIAVAQYSPAIAFALPVEGPTRIVNAQNAAYSRSAANIAAPSTAPQVLTFGQGEGKQARPEYPARAVREGQEGAVTVRLTVGETGRVMAAEVASPSPWPLLNESALRTIREKWRFSPGRVRVYEVSIRFQLTK